MAGSTLRWRYCPHDRENARQNEIATNERLPRDGEHENERWRESPESLVDDYLKALSHPDQNGQTRQSLTELEHDFRLVARAYGHNEGIDYSTWLSAGVPTHVLSEAGINADGYTDDVD